MIDLDAIDKRSAERDAAGAHCVATRETVDLLTAELRALREVVKAADKAEAALVALMGALDACRRGMDAWGHDEDGTHPEAWPAHLEARRLLGYALCDHARENVFGPCHTCASTPADLAAIVQTRERAIGRAEVTDLAWLGGQTEERSRIVALLRARADVIRTRRPYSEVAAVLTEIADSLEIKP